MTYSIKSWESAKMYNIITPQFFQSKSLRVITNTPWYISNHTLHYELKIPVKTTLTRVAI